VEAVKGLIITSIILGLVNLTAFTAARGRTVSFPPPSPNLLPFHFHPSCGKKSRRESALFDLENLLICSLASCACCAC
jgi:hypothetical protein